MADILPFCGIRYDSAAVGGNLAAVVAPPYDIISPAEQKDLYDRHPQNVVRLILGREDDRYASANRLFRQWLADGVLIADDRPSIYVYHQRFSDPVSGEPMPSRMGIICLLKLEEYSSGKVLPHENTLTAAKADRLNLLRATGAQFESIYGLYSDPDRSVESFISQFDDCEPVLERVDNQIGSSHIVERISDSSAIDVVRELLCDKPIFIADGHHRYETSLNYRREVRGQGDFPENTPIPADYILITLTAFEDEGLLVLPTHRQVRGLETGVIDGLPESLASQFAIAEIDRDHLEVAIEEAARAGRKAIGVVLPDRCLLATLNATFDEKFPEIVPGGMSPASKRLDVTILQSLILESRLGIDAAALAAGGKVGYTRSPREAVDSIESGEFQVAFVLGRPSVADVREVSLAFEKMPQKSTFFYPKLLSGLIMRDLGRDILAEVLNGDA